ncbi:hypothetical protein [Eisenibacter elegans]|uniref:hypothetical protein n=1 Tax=Eisenibacter elegans TaxID=997 RepID=UPI00047E6603|nr:hypothetical protein [Eisenibacter elegans]
MKKLLPTLLCLLLMTAVQELNAQTKTTIYKHKELNDLEGKQIRYFSLTLNPKLEMGKLFAE